uniref:ATP synthase F0 subunit b n=1 Tax=Cyanophora paradoxa TaxID=2762 RepID=E9P1E5_CYAPA|nr:ATP synthase F0 subunit b [Cyanophora paradoxa]ADW79197.1 ATP synthase F0 subunit b [Cyanophora paradoxa]
MRIKSYLGRWLNRLLLPIVVFFILAKEFFVLQEESIVLFCFFILLVYVIRIKKMPSQIKFNLETQRLQFITSIMYKFITMIYVKKRLMSLNNLDKNSNKYSQTHLNYNYTVLVLFLGNSIKNKCVYYLSYYINQLFNASADFFFIKKERSIEIIQTVLNKIYNIN